MSVCWASHDGHGRRSWHFALLRTKVPLDFSASPKSTWYQFQILWRGVSSPNLDGLSALDLPQIGSSCIMQVFVT